jgi:hypothetical protein
VTNQIEPQGVRTVMTAEGPWLVTDLVSVRADHLEHNQIVAPMILTISGRSVSHVPTYVVKKSGNFIGGA